MNRHKRSHVQPTMKFNNQDDYSSRHVTHLENNSCVVSDISGKCGNNLSKDIKKQDMAYEVCVEQHSSQSFSDQTDNLVTHS